MMLGGIFNKITRAGASNTANADFNEQLDALLKEGYEKTKEMREEVETQRARAAAKLTWLEENIEQIQNDYLEVFDAFDKADHSRALNTLRSIKDRAPAVVRFPVYDSEGNQSTFLSWLKTAFESGAKTALLKKEIKDALEKETTPIFEDLHVEVNDIVRIERSDYPELSSGLYSHISGKNEDKLTLLLAKVEWDIAREHNKVRDEHTEIGVEEKDKISKILFHSSDVLRQATIIARLYNALDGDSDTLYAKLKNNLPAIFKENGIEETILMLANNENGPSAFQKILSKSAYGLDELEHPIHAVLDALPNSVRAAALLHELAEQVEHPLMAQELKDIAADRSGEFMRTSDTNLINIPALAFLDLGKDGFKIAGHGNLTQSSLGPHYKDAIKRYLDRREDFSKRGETTYIRDGSISHMRVEPLDAKTARVYTTFYNQVYKNDMSTPEAYALLSAHEENDHLTKLLPQSQRLIDLKKVDHLWVEPNLNEIHYVVEGKTEKTTGLSLTNPADFGKAFTTLISGKKFTELAKGSMVDMRSVGHMWLSDLDENNDCTLNFIIGSKRYEQRLPYQHALTFIDPKLGKKHGHIALSIHESITPDNISLVSYKEEAQEDGAKKGFLVYVIGNIKYASEMNEAQAHKVMNKILADRPDFISHQEGGIINLSQAARITYYPEHERMGFVLGGDTWHSNGVNAKSWINVRDRLNSSDNYFSVTDYTYLHRHKVCEIGYNRSKDKLYFNVNGINDVKGALDIDKEHGLTVLERMEAHGIKQSHQRVKAEYEGQALEGYAHMLPEEPEPVKRPKTAKKPEKKDEKLSSRPAFSDSLPDVIAGQSNESNDHESEPSLGEMNIEKPAQRPKPLIRFEDLNI